MSKDQAAKIAEREYATDQHSEDHEVARANAYRPRLERAIRRAIASAVRKERERCVGIVQKECNTDIAWVGRTTVCKSIIKAINGGKRGKA